MKKLALAYIVLFWFTHSFSQERQGMIHDNYNPVYGQFVNPANVVDPKSWLDINFVGFETYARNNFLYFNNTSLIGAINEEFDDVRFAETNKQIRGFATGDIIGPSASLVVGQHSFSLFTNVRTIANVRNVPGILGKFIEAGEVPLVDVGIYNATNSRFKSMVWSEIGGTYGTILLNKGYTMISGAVTVKRLFGFQQSTLVVREAQVNVTAPDNAILEELDGTYAFSNGGINSGRGWGGAVGVTYKKLKSGTDNYFPQSKKGRCQYIDYRYRIGVSMLDIGAINFDEGAQTGTFNTRTNVDDLENGSFNDANGTSQFIASLPTVVSAQFDYNMNDYFYANATVIQRIPMASLNGVERPNVISGSIRYESPYFGVGLPITLIDYRNPQLGLGVRLANLTIGSDNLLPIFIKHNRLQSADFYLSLKQTFISNPKCKKRKPIFKNRQKSNPVKCPTF